MMVALPTSVNFAENDDISAPDIVQSELTLAHYIMPPDRPTQAGPEGGWFDFNHGCRIHLPPGDWQIKVVEEVTGHIFGEASMAEGVVENNKKYYVHYAFYLYHQGREVFSHRLVLAQRNVLVKIAGGALGEVLAWFPAVGRFQQRHGCNITCRMPAQFIELFASSYLQIYFITSEEQDEEVYYATYYLNAAIRNGEMNYATVDYQQVALHHFAAALLGLEASEVPARYALSNNSRPINEPYLCIGAQSAAHCKFWNNPSGWLELVAWLKSWGYRVICIDRDKVAGDGVINHYIPYGAQDQTGERPLSERMRWLQHAQFFVGLSSVLSWLSWTSGTPVVMISGFSHLGSEFYTSYRVINYHVCNRCWNDNRYEFDNTNYLWCLRLSGQSRQFECSRAITVQQVIHTINTIPDVRLPMQHNLAE
ncbi:autotransporter strand-loop-strand O-heptosyltransferase [Serratia sp. BIGb0234]|uniref:autotransporter strand-loop-strand O-heptosyltransferase n=1 Tax=Serratia sp. BIGb0234 TaxID=2940614 RepID=UPI002169126C|nr:autotransporter strand-loop-strand O-heptosyltransferase [Serratia sp. BIGb0234]MCS4320818.1 autotransporter strand-loop-strand O-heptosyltransferase [Serratia sp. BIGb0234]